MSGKGDGMIKRRRSLRKSGIRHITEIPVEERALYIEKRKQRTIEARKQQRKTHVMLAALLCLVWSAEFLYMKQINGAPQRIQRYRLPTVVEPAPTPTPVPTAWDRIWADSAAIRTAF